MFKKDELEKFLFLFSKADIIPFNNSEDALVNNFNVLDVPFLDYSKSVVNSCEHLKIEISENLLSLDNDQKLLYISFVLDKIRLETSEFDISSLIDLLQYYGVDIYTLDFEENVKLKNLLNTSFRMTSGEENLIKLRDLNREYYKCLLNNERVKVFEFVVTLIGEQTSSSSREIDNPYPRIFTSPKGFQLFEKLKAEFGDTRENLKNYSYVFRRMVDDNLIFPNLKKKEFIEFLSTHDIHIDRINTLNDIGNIEFRKHIYSNLKRSI